MTSDENRRYLRYLLARLAAFRNVWWSMANEYDFMLKRIPLEQWDRTLPEPWQDAIHIGTCAQSTRAHFDYDHTKPWVTHASVQKWDRTRGRASGAQQYQKAGGRTMNAEYEGNIRRAWGNISAQELVNRFWISLRRRRLRRPR